MIKDVRHLQWLTRRLIELVMEMGDKEGLGGKMLNLVTVVLSLR